MGIFLDHLVKALRKKFSLYIIKFKGYNLFQEPLFY